MLVAAVELERAAEVFGGTEQFDAYFRQAALVGERQLVFLASEAARVAGFPRVKQVGPVASPQLGHDPPEPERVSHLLQIGRLRFGHGGGNVSLRYEMELGAWIESARTVRDHLGANKRELSSHAYQPQLVKVPGATRCRDALTLGRRDALALELGDCAAQRRWLDVVDLGFELGA